MTGLCVVFGAAMLGTGFSTSDAGLSERARVRGQRYGGWELHGAVVSRPCECAADEMHLVTVRRLSERHVKQWALFLCCATACGR